MTATPTARGRRYAPWIPYSFVAPFVVTFLAFGAFPMLYAFVLSFTKWSGSGQPKFLGIENYTYLLTNPEFWGSLGNSAVMWVLVIPVQLVMALLLAVALTAKQVHIKGVLRACFILPFVTPLVAMAQVWTVVFDEKFGPINELLTQLGCEAVPWLVSTTWSKPTLALLFIWKATGFVMIILLAGLQDIPVDVYEAASIDGANRRRQMLYVTLPLMRRPMVFCLVIQTLAVIQMFAEPFVVTQGGPYGSTTTAGYYLYQHIQISDLGTGAANSILLVVLMLGLSLLASKLMKEGA